MKKAIIIILSLLMLISGCKSWENEEKCVQATYLYLYAKNDGQHHDPLYDPRFRGYKIRPVCD